MANVFIDTNILIYARDQSNPTKQRIAEEWLVALNARSAAVVNLQVTNEFLAVMLRRQSVAPLEDIQRAVTQLLEWGDTPITAGTIEGAWPIHASTGYQWFDCVLLASAIALGCTYFLSEDMQGGHDIGGLVIVNPFRTDRHAFFGMLN